MAFLLDTVVVSEPMKLRRQNAGVIEWLAAQRESDLFLSAMVLGEIELGIEKRRSDQPIRADRLTAWMKGLWAHYGDRILPFTPEVAIRWGRLAHRVGNTQPDVVIAATALEHGLVVVTRNVKDFEPMGVRVFNPWAAGADESASPTGG